MPFNPRDYFYIYDLPVPYKEGTEEELKLHPVTVKNYLEFHIMASCLLLEKNSVADVKVISMSRLQYLYSVADENNKLILLFDGLLRLVLDKPNMSFSPLLDDKGKAYFEIDGKLYDSYDFDTIREIISEQNSFELPDERIPKDIRDKMEEARRLREKINNSKMASLEDQMIAVAIYTGWEMDKIYSMTIRKFIKTLKRADHILHSKIYLQASMSGMVEFKDKDTVKHWLAEIEDNKMHDTIDLEDVESKVNFSSAT